METAIQTHNQHPAAVWSSGGPDYDQISRGISDSIDHCVLRLDPKPGERILDLATGTGWASRVVARRAGDRQARAAAARLHRLPRQFRDGTGHLRAARILGDGGCEKVILKGDEP